MKGFKEPRAWPSLLFYFFAPGLSAFWALRALREPLVRLGIDPFYSQIILLSAFLFLLELVFWWHADFLSRSHKFSLGEAARLLGLNRFPLKAFLSAALFVPAWLYLIKHTVAQPVLIPLMAWLKTVPFFAPPPWHYQVIGPPPSSALQQALLTAWMLGLNIFAEEVYFRGFLQREMEKTYGPWAWLLNALLFAAYHFFQGWMIPIAVVLALPICYAYHRTKSLYVTMIMHLLMNLFFGLALRG